MKPIKNIDFLLLFAIILAVLFEQSNAFCGTNTNYNKQGRSTSNDIKYNKVAASATIISKPSLEPANYVINFNDKTLANLTETHLAKNSNCKHFLDLIKTYNDAKNKSNLIVKTTPKPKELKELTIKKKPCIKITKKNTQKPIKKPCFKNRNIIQYVPTTNRKTEVEKLPHSANKTSSKYPTTNNGGKYLTSLLIVPNDFKKHEESTNFTKTDVKKSEERKNVPKSADQSPKSIIALQNSTKYITHIEVKPESTKKPCSTNNNGKETCTQSWITSTNGNSKTIPKINLQDLINFNGQTTDANLKPLQSATKKNSFSDTTTIKEIKTTPILPTDNNNAKYFITLNENHKLQVEKDLLKTMDLVKTNTFQKNVSNVDQSSIKSIQKLSTSLNDTKWDNTLKNSYLIQTNSTKKTPNPAIDISSKFPTLAINNFTKISNWETIKIPTKKPRLTVQSPNPAINNSSTTQNWETLNTPTKKPSLTVQTPSLAINNYSTTTQNWETLKTPNNNPSLKIQTPNPAINNLSTTQNRETLKTPTKKPSLAIQTPNPAINNSSTTQNWGTLKAPTKNPSLTIQIPYPSINNSTTISNRETLKTPTKKPSLNTKTDVSSSTNISTSNEDDNYYLTLLKALKNKIPSAYYKVYENKVLKILKYRHSLKNSGQSVNKLPRKNDIYVTGLTNTSEVNRKLQKPKDNTNLNNPEVRPKSNTIITSYQPSSSRNYLTTPAKNPYTFYYANHQSTNYGNPPCTTGHHYGNTQTLNIHNYGTHHHHYYDNVKSEKEYGYLKNIPDGTRHYHHYFGHQHSEEPETSNGNQNYNQAENINPRFTNIVELKSIHDNGVSNNTVKIKSVEPQVPVNSNIGVNRKSENIDNNIKSKSVQDNVVPLNTVTVKSVLQNSIIGVKPQSDDVDDKVNSVVQKPEKYNEVSVNTATVKPQHTDYYFLSGVPLSK